MGRGKAYNLSYTLTGSGSFVFGGGDVLIPNVTSISMLPVPRVQLKFVDSRPLWDRKWGNYLSPVQVIVRAILGPVFRLLFTGGMALKDGGKIQQLLGM